MEDSSTLTNEELDDQHVVEEADELLQLVQKAVSGNLSEQQSVYQRFKAILYKYQEQSHLLDSLLEDIITPLSTELRKQAVEASGININKVKSVCRLLNVVTVVKGYKTVVKFYPHEAMDLERVLKVLTEVKISASGQLVTDPDDGLASWEAQSTLLLWMSILILIPFDLETVDSASESNAASSRSYTALVGTVLDLCKEYLHHPGTAREMAALLLGRLLTRPDMGPALSEFLAWAIPTLQSAGGPEAAFFVPGILHTQALIFKLGTRQRLLPYAPRVWAQLPPLLDAEHVAGSVLARKLAVKLAGRVGNTFLEPRLAPWRYVATTSSLDATLGDGSTVANRASIPQDSHTADDDEDLDLAEEVEDVLGVLLSALRDRDTVVRWSAAKGVGRLTGCLPKELADDITASVLDLFRASEGDAGWHGGCLALAELARRGLLPPERLPAIVPLLQRALQYDVRRGPCSIGTHVRDAAAYVCWAFARAYDPVVLQGYVLVVAAALLVTACYDREVNCRRAAAAAFQESVGRLGNFPHGIDILTVADYFSVGNISTAYLRVACYIAQYPEYQAQLPEHLLSAKLRHWEKPLRQLAARGLAALVPSDPDFYATSALDTLLPTCQDVVLEVRHGAVLGVAELLPALHAAGCAVEASRLEQVGALPEALEKGGLFKGKGGELMREAICRLVECMAEVQMPLATTQHDFILRFIDDSLRHPVPAIQTAAVSALKQYARGYLKDTDRAQTLHQVARKYASRLHDPYITIRRGYIQALGAVPKELIASFQDVIIAALCDACKPEEDVEQRDVLSRALALRSLRLVVQELYQDALPAPAAQHLLIQIAPCLKEALQDYTTDNRGDVGSWVREAAMLTLTEVVCLLAKHHLPTPPTHTPTPSTTTDHTNDSSSQPQPDPAQSPLHTTDSSASVQLQQQIADLAGEAVGQLAKQAVERIARVREAAATSLQRLLTDVRIRPVVPSGDLMEAAVPTDEVEVEGIVSLEAVSKLTTLLQVPQYQEPVLEGLIASIGGIDNSLSKAASNALITLLAGKGSSPSLLPQALACLLGIWANHARSSRLATPIIKTTQLLLSRTNCAGVSVSNGRTFASAILDLTRAELKQCADVARVLEGSSVVCHLAGLQDQPDVQSSALQSAMALMVSKYPKVRRHTAEQLYMTLLAWDVDCEEEAGEQTLEERVEAASDILLGTAWDGGMAAVKVARQQVADTLKITLREPVKKGGGGGGVKAVKTPVVVSGQQGTYQSLIDDAARGWGY